MNLLECTQVKVFQSEVKRIMEITKDIKLEVSVNVRIA